MGSVWRTCHSLREKMKPELTSRIQMKPDGELLPLAISRSDGSSITAYFYTRSGGDLQKKPAIFLLHGSGANSVFSRSESGLAYPLLFEALHEVRNDWNIFFVEKRGVCFGDDTGFDGFERCSQEYLEWATYQNRVSDVCRVLDMFSEWKVIDPSLVVIIGSSEGSDVATGVAATSSYPTHIALLPLSAGHGLFDGLLSLRKELEQGKITTDEFHEQYDWLVDTFREIHGDSRNSIEKGLWGHSYRRWSSHCSGAVLSDLLEITIPIFLGIPSLDPAESIDWVVTESVRQGRKNLTYRNYVGYDHGFFEHTDGRAECRHHQVLKDILDWVARTSGQESV